MFRRSAATQFGMAGLLSDWTARFAPERMTEGEYFFERHLSLRWIKPARAAT